MSELADAIPRDHPLRHALHVKAAPDRLDVLRTRFEQTGREPPALLPDLDRGSSERAPAESGAAAPERPDGLGRSQRVAVPYAHVRVGAAQVHAHDLPER